MIELLQLCGFEAYDIESELPSIEKAFNKLGITAEDIKRGKERVTKYYDIELQGVRKLLKLNVQEVVDSILAREDGKAKLVYGFMAPGFDILGSALASKSKDVRVSYLPWVFQTVAGCIFDKIVPILEAAEARWMKSGLVSHCGNVKTLVGLLSSDIVPLPDLVVTSGSLCETAPKTLDLIHEFYDIPIYVYDICQDREFQEYGEASKRIMEFAVKGLKGLVEKTQEVVGFEISDDMLGEVLGKRGQLMDTVSKLNELIRSSDPLPINPSNANLWAYLSSMSLSINRLDEAIDAVKTLYEELKERVNEGVGVIEKGAPRILSLHPNNHVDPESNYLMGELGMALVGNDSGFIVPEVKMPRNPYETWSMYQYSSLYTSLAKRVPLLIEGCKKSNIVGVINRLHVGCRGVVADTILINEAIRKELEIPVLILDEESFDPRDHDHEQYRKQLEIFKTML